MSKPAIAVASFAALLFTAAPAFPQDRVAACPAPTAANGHVKVFDGKTFAATDPTGAAPGRRPGFDGPHGSATNLRDRPSSDPTEAAPTRRPGFEGPHGSATNLRDRPSDDPTAFKKATLYGRKAGDDKRTDGPSAPNRGLVKHGAGTLTYATPDTGESALLLPAVQKVREAAARMKATRACR